MPANNNLRNVWDKYYESPGDTALKDSSFFRLELHAINTELKKALYKKRKEKEINILEIGCGTGPLIEYILKNNTVGLNVHITGIDFSTQAIAKAQKRNLPGCEFLAADFFDFLKFKHQVYDVIISQRTIMAAVTPREQKQLLLLLSKAKKKNGTGIFSEVTKDTNDRLNKLRKKLGLPNLEKIWHSRHLRLSDVQKHFKTVDVKDFSATYWLITRVIYPYFEKNPQHNTKLAKFASEIEQTGNYSFVKLLIVT